MWLLSWKQLRSDGKSRHLFRSPSSMKYTRKTIYWLHIAFQSINQASYKRFYLWCFHLQSWLRVSQQLHTVSQVLVGAVLGSTCGIVWFWMWHSFVFEAFIASIWVRILVVLGSAAFCAAFLIYVIRHWLQDEHWSENNGYWPKIKKTIQYKSHYFKMYFIL